MAEREQEQSRLLEAYWGAVTEDPQADPPEGLDAGVAATVRQMQIRMAPPEPEPAFAEDLRRRLETYAAGMPRSGRADGRSRRPIPFFGFQGRRVLALAAALLVMVAGLVLAAGVVAGGLEQPTVAYFGPTASKDVPSDAPVAITFDRPMLAPLTERALRISPAVDGSTSWKGNTLLFTPSAGWARGIRYTVSLDQSARSLLMLPLKEAVAYEFMTAKDLSVVTVQPADGATDVAANSSLVVQFSYPIVPLGTTGGEPNPLRIEPALKGKGRWVTTSLYMFQPEGGFPAGVRFIVTVPKGLADTAGSALAEDYSWSFTTKAPSVGKVTPDAGSRYVGLRPEIRVTFDQPVDHPSAEQRFSLKGPGGAVLAGGLTWDGETLVYQPRDALQRETGYTATVAVGVKAARGGGETKEFGWSFTTVGVPRVLSTLPAAGAPKHPPYDSVQIQFSNPMDQESVEKNLTLSPKPSQLHFGWQESDTRLYLWGGGLKPSTRYTLALAEGATDRYGQKLPPFNATFTTGSLPPRLNVAIPGMVGTFNAATSPVLYLQHVNVSRIDLALYRLDQAEFLRMSDNTRGKVAFAADEKMLVRRWSEKASIAESDQSGLTSTYLGGGPGSRLPSGFYFLRVDSPEGLRDERLLMVSRLALTMKKAQGQALVWVTDLTGGDVVPNLPLRIMSADGKTLATGKTDKDGLLLATGLPVETPGRGPIPQTFAFAEGEGDLGAVGSEWASGIHPYEFNVPWDPFAQPYRGALYTDRPIYRPGQKVLFKGIVRSDDDAHYTIPSAGTELSLEVRDSRGRQVHSDRVKLSDMGTFDGQLPLAPEAALGNYYVNARLGEWGFGVGFTVAEYRKPEFEVKIAPSRESYLPDDQVSVAGSASYYFGQPLADSPIQWRVTSRNYLFSGIEGYQWVDYDLVREAQMLGGRVRTQGKGTTDAQGGFAFQFPADLSKDPLSQYFTIEATITDANNQEVSAATEAVVHKGERYVGLRPDRYVAKTGESASVELLVVDTQKKAVPGAPVSVSVYSRKGLSVKEKQPDGGYLWTSKPEDTLLTTATVTTGSEGKARASVATKEPGSIRVVAEVADPRGNRMRTASCMYVSGSGYASWRMESNDRLELVPDRKEYGVGDTARVLIPSPMEQSLALVTVERGKLLSHRLVRLKGNSETLEVPIQGDYIPNVYVSALLFKGGGAGGIAAFKVGYGELKVAVADKGLKIDITLDKARYEPGDKAAYTLKTTDSSGKGVPAELSLAVVDASVLALADDSSPKLVDSFWGRRAIGVNTASTLTQSVDRFNENLPKENKGAGGGGEEPSVRRQFPDTAFWNPALRTDEKGEAKVTLTLPDNLTTWRATARGVTASTQVGSASVDTVTSKSLLLRPAFPRFLLMGDRVTLATLLHNYGEREVEVEVSLAAKGVRPEEGSEFAPQRVKVAPGDLQRLEWPAVVESVPGGGSQAVLSLAARPLAEGVPSDSVEMTLPVHTLTTAEVVATSGEVRDSTTELVRLPEGINPDLGELTVETSPSLAAGMRYSVRYLEEFPYECTEQTVSRFLPRVVMQRAFEKLVLPDKEGIASQLPSIVGRSLQRLYGGQRPDGGWGWWPGDSSDQWITAYAVQGLAEARRSGYTVDQGVLDRAAQFLRRSLDRTWDVEHPENPNSRAYVLYSLALAGKGDLGLTNALYDRRSTLGNNGRAYLLLALRELQAGDQDGNVSSLLSDLTGAAISSATGAHWEESEVDRRTMNTNTRSTAVVLDALVRADPGHPLIASTVRWLMVARKDGHWETTQETAASLLALTDYLEASGELKGDFAYRVNLNGGELATERVTQENVDEAQRLVIGVRDLLGGDNRVKLDRAKPGLGQSGEGKLYYTMHLRYFLPGEQVPAMAEGLALVREYYRLGDESSPIDRVAPGETLKVKLTVVALQDLHYVVVEDPLPSGLEAVDTRLKTTSRVAQEETGGIRKEDMARGKEDPPWWKYDYFQHVEPRDDRVALFATYLPKGTYEYSYLARATSSGEFQALPTRGYEMYFPEVWGRSDGGKMTIE
ncbi:MAG: Ig-like domain-containing protein [Chloroflexota bacterium]